jgi:signal transduction histidine kinase
MSAQNYARSRAGNLPMGQPLLVLLVAVLVTGGLWVWVTIETPADGQVLVGVVGGLTALGLAISAAVAVYRAQEARLTRRYGAAMDAELGYLADHLLPAVVARLRDGASADTVYSQLPKPNNDTHQRILGLLTREISIGERRRAAAMAACGNAAGRVQALATSMLADLRDMENRYSDDVLGDLLRIDHSTAQTGRLADSIAVLTGARSGRRWTKPIVMESILRGAMGRIGAYQRVHVHSTSAAAVAGYAAEDVMHALAELMDNATKFSAPSEEVHVYVEELHNGVVITIEDGGLGMKPQALERAKSAISPTGQLDLTQLSGTRLGLAVVGCLARKHQLQVFFRPSSRGGTGVVLRIPNQLITQPRQRPMLSAARQQATAPARVPAARYSAPTQGNETSAPAPAEQQPITAVVDGESRGGLPKRPRGQTLTAATARANNNTSNTNNTTSNTSTAPQGTGPQSTRPRIDAGARFGAFREARSRNTDIGGAPAGGGTAGGGGGQPTPTDDDTE